jgi:arylsulfatase A-like enzyme
MLFAGCADPHPAPALIVVALDNVRWDRTTLSGSAHPRTPALAGLAALPGSITFTRAYAAAPFSLASYASLFTSRDLVHHGVGLDRWVLDDEATTLAEALRGYGWHTAAFTGGVQLAAETGLDQGFDTFDAGSLSPLATQLDAAVGWLRRVAPSNEPFFLLVHGYDAHVPYRAPPVLAEAYDPDYRGFVHEQPRFLTTPGLSGVQGGAWRGEDGDHALSPADVAHVAAHYDAAVRTGDYTLGRLLVELEALGLLDRATVVVLADHGEQLGEHGRFAHGPKLSEEVLHVPVVLHRPRPDAPREWGEVFSLVDLAPTLLADFGLVPLAGDGRVCDLDDAPTPGVAKGAAQAYRAVRDRDWLAVENGDGWELQRDGAGPDVAAEHPDVVARLAAEVAAWPTGRVEPGVPDEELARELRAGGYWNAR